MKYKSEQEIKNLILENIKYYSPRTEFKENNVFVLKTGFRAMDDVFWDTGEYSIIFNVEMYWQDICKLPEILNMYIKHITPHLFTKYGNCFVLHCEDKN